MAYVLLQSYTANLSSILTVSQLTPSGDKIDCAGFQEHSFVEDMLKNMSIKSVKCKTMEDYDKFLSLGCKKGGVDAIFDEMPYIKLFLHKYGSKYKMAGATHSTGGFGFVSRSSPPRQISYYVMCVYLNGLELMENGLHFVL